MMPSRLLVGLGLLSLCPQAAQSQDAPILIDAPKQAVPQKTAKITNPPSARGEVVLSFLPRSFQTNPRTDISVICEMTEEGRKRPVVTPQSPASYLSHDAGFTEAGAPDSVKMPDQEALRTNLKRALAHNGFHPATEGKAPDYALAIHWGTHTVDPETDTMASVLSRAMLVGGRTFAKELAEVLQQEYANREQSMVATENGGVLRVMRNDAQDSFAAAVQRSALDSEQLQSAGGSALSISRTAGNSLGREMDTMLSPLAQFRRKNPRNEFLVEQSLGNIYFAVITAVDPVALANGKKVVLWRARMSIDANGISLTDALPALLNNGAAFMGRDMDEAATMVPNVMRNKAETKIGDIQVLSDEEVEKQRREKK